jgi:uncharacterized protein (DUF488 family)
MRLYTIGHSNHTPERFAELLHETGVTALVDVRSQPYSRYATSFNHEELARRLADQGIVHVYLGDRLGGRPSDPRFYDCRGYVLYGEMAASGPFLAGIERLERLASERTVAVMCGEEDPAECHRHVLIARVLLDRGHEVLHVRGSGDVVSATELFAARAASQQLSLFEEEPEQWISTRSVSPGGARNSSSSPSAPPASDDSWTFD